MTKVIFIDNGIEFDSVTVKQKASGGAETAFVSLVEELAKLGLDVVVFNNAINVGKYNGVVWKRLSKELDNEKFDVIVVNRGDKYLNYRKECKKRIFWIHNPANYLLKYRYLSKIYFNPPTIVFSSKYHLDTYPAWLPNKRKVIIPYGIDDFIFKIKKKNSLPQPNAIFTSNPMRGLNWLLDRWEDEIYPQVPQSKLFLYTGAQTYGSFGKKHEKEILAVTNRAKNLITKGVVLKNPIQRKHLMREISKAKLFLYQGSKDETFCMSVAEAQVIGIPAVVCNLGCMSERVKNNKTGFVSDDDKSFSKAAVKILKDDKYWNKIHDNMKKNDSYKTWNDVGKEWKKIIT